MTTTHLFVELLVIGCGALIWLGLLVAMFTGTDVGDLCRAVEKLWMVGAGSSFVVFLPIAYVLGILTDRIADRSLKKCDTQQRQAVFGSDIKVYFRARRTLVLEGKALWEHLEYLRSRLRICRGWAANSLITFVVVAAYWIRLEWEGQYVPRPVFVLSELGFLLLFCACIFCWLQMNRGEYEKTRRQAVWLNSRKKEPPSTDAGTD